MPKNTSILAIVCLLLPAVVAAERLPLVAAPEHYTLTFTPDLKLGEAREQQ